MGIKLLQNLSLLYFVLSVLLVELFLQINVVFFLVQKLLFELLDYVSLVHQQDLFFLELINQFFYLLLQSEG